MLNSVGQKRSLGTTKGSLHAMMTENYTTTADPAENHSSGEQNDRECRSSREDPAYAAKKSATGPNYFGSMVEIANQGLKLASVTPPSGLPGLDQLNSCKAISFLAGRRAVWSSKSSSIPKTTKEVDGPIHICWGEGGGQVNDRRQAKSVNFENI